MATALTIDDIWKLFQETNRVFQEAEKRNQEADKRNQENERIMRENERIMRENERTMREADARLGARIAQVSRQIGHLGSRWGEFVEGLVAPACITLFTERGIPVDEIFSRAKRTLAGEHMEIDLLVANTVAAVLVEVKSRLTVEDVRQHLQRLARFKSFFPRYADCQVYGAVAGITVDAEADTFAMHQGLFVIEQSGETVRLANPQTFTPRTW
ncbi:MAG: DUF3782 domain-containing protein [Magnetococcales bacterium]|nr:DUF3782 domain-containing protein [Magnetococcales bacterium]